MTMDLDERSSQILHEILINPSIKNKDLEERFSLSRRQVGYSINKINDWLIATGLPEIKRTKSGLFLLNKVHFTTLLNENALDETDAYILSENERVNLLILMLLSRSEELSLYHFTSCLSVSRNTIINDLKNAQLQLDIFDLTIKYYRQYGYLIEGKEFNKRQLLINIIFKTIEMTNGKRWIGEITSIPLSEIETFHERVEEVERKLNLKFTDEKIESMPYILILLLRRITQGKLIEPFHIHYYELSDTKEFQAAEELLQDLDQIPMEERLFITLHLLTTNVSSSERNADNTFPELYHSISLMLSLFEKNACVRLQEKDQLLNKILLHVKPAYYRIKYKLSITNPLENTVSNEFKELHHLVRKSMRPLEQLIGGNIPESESTYFTMLIGGWLSRQGDSLQKKIKALVVCPKGICVSRLLESTLRELFPEFVFIDALSVREFHAYTLDYDLVFTTTFLQTNRKQILVKTFLEREEKYRLRKQVMQELNGYTPSVMNVYHVIDIIEKHATIESREQLQKELESHFRLDHTPNLAKPMELPKRNLNELIVPETITLEKRMNSWQEALQICSRPLVKSGSVTPSYVEEMLRLYDNEDPYIIIGNNIAIPHADPESGVNEVSMSLLRLEEPVQYNEYSVRIIITIAALDKHQHLRALMQLMKLASNQEDTKRLIESKSSAELLQVISKYSAV